ncbi:hypothetical protein BpHYR1_001681 [Brachionus plicatilis]|uniref:Uncharacterized protein n=1 Tax=Brachionus plicatilis TaxID=10195 RepID=A0A3M7SPL2_BRAPC|nr:hypothetical protein BpHYR1_001681 [Brachionus plicatilis]
MNQEIIIDDDNFFRALKKDNFSAHQKYILFPYARKKYMYSHLDQLKEFFHNLTTWVKINSQEYGSNYFIGKFDIFFLHFFSFHLIHLIQINLHQENRKEKYTICVINSFGPEEVN